MKSDICTYSTIDPNESIGALIIRVGEILYVGNSKFISSVESATDQFRVGWVTGILPQGEGITFTGLGIQLGKFNRVILPQKQYDSKLPTLGIS